MSATSEAEVSGVRPEAFEAFDAEPEIETPASPTPVSPSSELDDIEKQVIERVWHVKGVLTGRVRGQDRTEEFDRTYVQKPLSYLAMMQFTALLGRSLDSVMSGPEGFSMENIGDVLSVQGADSMLDGGLFQRTDFDGVDSFLRGIAKLSSYIPEMLAEAQCIWLRVPLRERLAVVEIWSKPVDEGGLSMDDGEEMLNVFIQQNYEELEAFLAKRLRRISQTWRAARKRLHPAEDEE